MAEPIITTVIPTFRRPILLKRAIESVLVQSFRDLVVCVYDNASNDETEEIVKEIAKRDSRVLYFKNDKNIGGVANILQGINAVKTPYYSLLSDDDFLLPSFYESAVKAYMSFPRAGFVCTKTIIVDLIDKKLQFRNQDWQSGFYEPSNEIVSKMYSSHFVTTSVLLHVSVRDTIGVFEPSGSDSLYMTIAAASFPFVVIDDYGGALTLHQDAYSMIEGGIAKETTANLYSNFLMTNSNVINLKIANELKVSLLLHITKSYQQYFDIKKINFLTKKPFEEGVRGVEYLPNLFTPRGVIVRMFQSTPSWTHFLLSLSFNFISYFRRIKHKFQGNAWADLPIEAYDLLNNNADALAIFNSIKSKIND